MAEIRDPGASTSWACHAFFADNSGAGHSGERNDNRVGPKVTRSQLEPLLPCVCLDITDYYLQRVLNFTIEISKHPGSRLGYIATVEDSLLNSRDVLRPFPDEMSEVAHCDALTPVGSEY